ncbi:MAG: c-type cytochrome [Planctomycetota bacterium]
MVAVIVLFVSSLVAVESTRPARPPEKIFAATCATCHGQDGLGNHQSWVLPGRMAPRIARGLPRPELSMEERYRFTVRNGPYRGATGFSQAMPAFGPEVISDAELGALVTWLLYAPPYGQSDPAAGVPAPRKPSGHQIVLEIVDHDPWFQDDGADARDPFADRRRVVLSPGDYIKVVNHGKTWHTVTNTALERDTGFIGYRDNIPGQDVGFYYLEAADLAAGAWKYYCKLHPYMQVEIVSPASSPLPLTFASKLPLSVPAVPGLGEVWVGLQTFDNTGLPDGAVQVFRAADWSSDLITAVGNNPHNGWIGKARDSTGAARDIVVYANWHDTSVTVIDAVTHAVIGSAPTGAANAHVMTAPHTPGVPAEVDRWFVTVMGSNKVQELDPFASLLQGEPTLPAIAQADGEQGKPAMAPHGLWFVNPACFLTADTLADKVSLYSLGASWQDRRGRAGQGAEVGQASTGGRAPLAAAIMNLDHALGRRDRAFANNAGTDDISVFDIDATPGQESVVRATIPPPLGNAAGNIALTDMSVVPLRWAHMPIQCPVSPPDSTAHGRYVVVCNKASFNVSIIALDRHGDPLKIYTFPAGLGAHGVGFGRKASASSARDDRREHVAYYAYVTNTFENYVSVYDLELLEQLIALEQIGRAPPAFAPGGATEQVLLDGLAAQLIAGQPSARAGDLAQPRRAWPGSRRRSAAGRACGQHAPQLSAGTRDGGPARIRRDAARSRSHHRYRRHGSVLPSAATAVVGAVAASGAQGGLDLRGSVRAPGIGTSTRATSSTQTVPVAGWPVKLPDVGLHLLALGRVELEADVGPVVGANEHRAALGTADDADGGAGRVPCCGHVLGLDPAREQVARPGLDLHLLEEREVVGLLRLQPSAVAAALRRPRRDHGALALGRRGPHRPVPVAGLERAVADQVELAVEVVG